DLHQAGARQPERDRRGRARAAPRLARAQGGAVRPGRSALAGAGPVRVPAGHRQAGRLRDDRAPRPQGEAPGGGRVPRLDNGRGRRDRRGRRRALPRRRRGGAGRAGCGRNPRQGARDARAGGRARRVAGGERRVEAELLERAGVMAYAGARADQAAARFERAIALLEEVGARHAAARVSARLAEILWDRGRIEDGLETMDRAFEVLSAEERDADVAALAAQIARFRFFAGDIELAAQRIETALDMAEALVLPEVLSQALNTKAIILFAHDRPREGLTLLRFALEAALEHDKPSAAMRAYYNLADSLARLDEFEQAVGAARDG